MNRYNTPKLILFIYFCYIHFSVSCFCEPKSDPNYSCPFKSHQPNKPLLDGQDQWTLYESILCKTPYIYRTLQNPQQQNHNRKKKKKKTSNPNRARQSKADHGEGARIARTCGEGEGADAEGREAGQGGAAAREGLQANAVRPSLRQCRTICGEMGLLGPAD
ncbi:hypothetical protein QJS04_geneDACA016688 [Acorus gramineus]|uniref:Secreted protein n=1 Tax=Acorus gramineus TaxID=55184 RepID=A0AAV9AQ42_ACOGR|nr:hypothetical protein QJS04_geneDACA016688 [Acorus gramineus]